MREMQQLRLLMGEFMRACADDPRTPALLAQIRDRTAALTGNNSPCALAPVPNVFVAQIPFYVSPSDADRDVQIVLNALDYYSIFASSESLDRSRNTVRLVSEMAYQSLHNEAKRALGSRFNPPVRNPRRKPPKVRD